MLSTPVENALFELILQCVSRYKVEWVERDGELNVICIKVVIKGKEESTETGSVHDEDQRAEHRALGNTTRGSMKG